ncbi:haloacid dehalogenase [Alteromonas sp. KS69]|jgi:putative hydrolase of the HAD superfamily|uniref:HAD family hydrolase n=1 Tax=Alteromonas sp. KS69 TaxID=2109917 RepID=UPI000F8773A9|nr:HAD hydrolase-like protein [Alteromonas sp. KS69]RUP82640.1 haloacid dehalogenase [Alteromonas sp. KS69]|tara:strand:- start:23791 stop:24447 length:657 start_codon:yes stop_codon:yes gene_type:complete
MIYIFDLDDTLYDERQYVESGLRAVANYVEYKWQVEKIAGFDQLINLLDRNGRGRIFNDYLAKNNIPATKKNVKECVTVYRLHKPVLSMAQQHLQLLHELPKPLYLVTDGNKVVQANKVEALNIRHLFKRIFITHRFGVKHAKPSTYCFEKIRLAEACDWNDMVYVGDNPAKDFVNLNRLGMHTVRVLTGVHRSAVAKPLYDAHYTVKHITDLRSLEV